MSRIEKFKKLNQALKELDIPVAYHHFDEPVETPFLVYYSPEENNFIADNEIFHRVDYFEIELYTDKKDLILEEMIHEALTELGIIYRRYEVYIQQEKLLMQTYQIEM